MLGVVLEDEPEDMEAAEATRFRAADLQRGLITSLKIEWISSMPVKKRTAG